MPEQIVETVWGERITEKAFERLLRLIFEGPDPADEQQVEAEGGDAA